MYHAWYLDLSEISTDTREKVGRIVQMNLEQGITRIKSFSQA